MYVMLYKIRVFFVVFLQKKSTKMKNKAIFPGSFDPFTIGHENIVRRALLLFDEIIIAIGYNSEKPGFFTFEQRKQWILQTFADEKRISVESYNGLTVDFCKKKEALFIIRGLRSAADFEYEKSIAHLNKGLNETIETVFLLTEPEHSSITSTLVREVVRHGGDASRFVPKGITLVR
jgi:pantetheine-phosphate adenylyltransferase